MIKKIIITDDVEIVKAAVSLKVENIMVDLETFGKKDRQHLVDAHFTDHSFESIDKVSGLVKGSETKLLVRCNPIGAHSEVEIDNIINRGAELVMLPMFRTYDEVFLFKSIIGGRVPVVLLVETRDALLNFKKISKLLSPEDRVHFGLNDLSIEFGFSFLFDVLEARLLDGLCAYCYKHKIEFGIGGVGSPLVESKASPSFIISEHVRLNSSWVILSRAFKSACISKSNFNENIFKRSLNQLNELTKL